MDMNKAMNLGNKMAQMSEYIERLVKWSQYNNESEDYSLLRERFDKAYESIWQCLAQAESKQQEVVSYINPNDLFEKKEQLDICIDEMNIKATEIDVANKLVDCASQILQIERVVEAKQLSEENANKYINGNYTINLQKTGSLYSTTKENIERFDTELTLGEIGLNLFEMSKNYENSLSITNDNPKSTQEEVDELCKIPIIEQDKQDVENINTDKQQLDIHIQQALNDVVKDIGSNEVIDDWINDLQYIETCLTEEQHDANGRLYYKISDAITRINIMENRIDDFQMYATMGNINLDDKVNELKILEQQVDELTARTKTATSEYVGKGSEIIVDKIDTQIKAVSSLEQMPANIVDDFTKYNESVMKQVAIQLKATQKTTQIQVNPQLMDKCKNVNETCKQFSNGQIQTI